MYVPPTIARSFKIHTCLGRGGFGEVYRATMFTGGRGTEVAVKILHANVDTESQAVQRLRDERRILGALVHPSILRVHDLTVIEGRIALVTEFVEGADLDKCCKPPDALSPRGIFEVGLHVADALNAAFHTPAPDGKGSLELVHRDIKPANIRVCRNGEVRLLDFGVARAQITNLEAQTMTGSVFGSYPYMAPERFVGAITLPSCDVYGLAATLYEAACGHRLWQVQLSEIFELVVNKTRYRAALRDRMKLLPQHAKPAEELLSSMLAFSADARPSAREVRDAMAAILPTLEGPGLAKWSRRRKWQKPRVLPGLLSGRVFVEDAVDPHEADNLGRELNWEANDQEDTVMVNASTAESMFDDPDTGTTTRRPAFGDAKTARRDTPPIRPSLPPWAQGARSSKTPAGTLPRRALDLSRRRSAEPPPSWWRLGGTFVLLAFLVVVVFSLSFASVFGLLRYFA